jgi:hypothetical protein
MTRIPKGRKRSEQLRPKTVPDTWAALPPDGCDVQPPAWPIGRASGPQPEMWRRLWSPPVAAWWWAQRIDPSVVARYVELPLAEPEVATLSRLESELGLTPASLLRLRLTVEHPEPVSNLTAIDHYALSAEGGGGRVSASWPLVRFGLLALPLRVVAVLVMEPEAVRGEPPFDGSSYRSAVAPAVGVAAAGAVVRVVDALDECPAHVGVQGSAGPGGLVLRA